MIESEVLQIGAKEEARARTAVSWTAGLRLSEKFAFGYFVYVGYAATLFPLAFRERLSLTLLNLAASGVIVLLNRYASDLRAADRSQLLTAIRNWFPSVLILVAFREAGLLCQPDVTHRLDNLFESWDAVLLHSRLLLGVLRLGAPGVENYLELCYLLVYPFVPLGLGALLLARRAERSRVGETAGGDSAAVDRFWSTVLLAALVCYGLFPYFPTTPPRVLWHDAPGPAVPLLFRKLSLWILGRYGIESSVFPSGHVTTCTATALAVLADHRRLGWVFLFVAASIAASTVYGRYHFAVDAVAGAAIAVAAHLVARQLRKR